MKESFLIEPTDCTPRVVLDADECRLTIEGESFPENVRDFYEPIVQQIAAFLEVSKKLEVRFDLRYFNTSSSKTFLDFLEMLESHYEQGSDLKVIWLYQKGIEVMQENGEDFADDLRLPFELKPY